MKASLVLLALLLVGQPATKGAIPQNTGPAPKTAAVLIKDFAFIPAVLTISVGETVTWTNEDEDPHSVVANNKSFRSRALDTGEKDSVVFEKAGEYGYYCSLHPHMTAKIVVTAP